MKPTKWTRNSRSDGRIEYICEHGVGHTDYASAVKCADTYGEWEQPEAKERGITREDVIGSWMSHGCDGCCGHDDFPGKKEGVKTMADPIRYGATEEEIAEWKADHQ